MPSLRALVDMTLLAARDHCTIKKEAGRHFGFAPT
jgi:hypothetical protein